MAVRQKVNNEFLAGLEDVKSRLEPLQFREVYFEEKGYANFVKYQGDKIAVEFMFGPPEYEVEMYIHTPRRRFDFVSLIAIPAISEWANANSYTREGERNIKNEVLWLYGLFMVSLPILKQ